MLVFIHMDLFSPLLPPLLFSFFHPSVLLPPHVSAGFIVCLSLKGSREKGVDEEKIEKDAKVRHQKVQQKKKKKLKTGWLPGFRQSVACCWLPPCSV